MNWEVVAPLASGAILALITAGGAVLVARSGSGEQRRDRESDDIWKMVEQMQKQLDRGETKATQDEARIEQLELKVDEQRKQLREHEDRIAELTREKLELQQEVARLMRRLTTQEDR